MSDGNLVALKLVEIVVELCAGDPEMEAKAMREWERCCAISRGEAVDE